MSECKHPAERRVVILGDGYPDLETAFNAYGRHWEGLRIYCDSPPLLPLMLSQDGDTVVNCDFLPLEMAPK